VHDGQCRSSYLDQVRLPAGSRILANKGYCSAENDQLLRQRGLRSGIQRKAHRHKPVSVWEKRYNRLIGRRRYKIERVFGSIKRCFGRLEARYVGMTKTHGQHVLEAIAYNFTDSWGLSCPGHSKNREKVHKKTPGSHKMG
jgi:transposase, IS5 family